MKKILFFLIPFLIIIFPFHVHAEALPEIAEPVFQVIEGGMQDAISSIPTWKGISPYLDAGIQAYEVFGAILTQVSNMSIESAELHTCDVNDCDVSRVSQEQLALLKEKESTDGYHVYDRDNNVIDLGTTPIYTVNFDNGFFHGQTFIDSHGQILYYGQAPSGARTMAKILFGGTYWAYGDWNYFADLAAQTVTDNNMAWNPHISDLSDISWYLTYGYFSTSQWGTNHEIYSIFIPDMYAPGSIIKRDSSGETWYFNLNSDGSKPFVYKASSANPSSPTGYLSFSAYTTEFNGYTYNYVLHAHNSISEWNAKPTISIQDFYNLSYAGVVQQQYYVIESNFPTWSAEKSNEAHRDETHYFMPLQWPDGSVIHPELPEDEIDLDSLAETSEMPEIAPEANPDYDPSEELSPDNYPYTYPQPVVMPWVRPSPIPGIIVGPGPGPGPTPDPTPDPTATPSLDPDIEEDPSILPGGRIPILHNIQNRFPFCIPFDVYRFVNAIGTVQATPPAWDFDWSITVWEHTYTVHVQGDLSDYEPLAIIFRELILISFILAIMFWSYTHYF